MSKSKKLGDNLVKSNVIEEEVSNIIEEVLKEETIEDVKICNDIPSLKPEMVSVPLKELVQIWKKCITGGTQDLTGYGAIRYFGMGLFGKQSFEEAQKLWNELSVSHS